MKIHPLPTLPGWQNDLEGKPIRCNAIKNFSEAPSMILFKKNLFTYNAVTYIGQQKSHLYRKGMGFRIRQRWVWVSALFSLVVTKPLEQVTTPPNLSFFSKIQIIPPRFQDHFEDWIKTTSRELPLWCSGISVVCAAAWSLQGREFDPWPCAVG